MHPSDPHRQLALLQRRKNVAERYLRGQTQWEIARAFEVDQKQISRDLQWIRQQWLAEAKETFDFKKAKELAKIDDLERIARQAWEDSKRPREIKSTEEGVGARGSQSKIALRTEHRDGNPAFLDRVAWCIETRLKVLGLINEKTNVNFINLDWDRLFGRAQEPDPVEAKIAEAKKTVIELPPPKEGTNGEAKG